MIVLTVLRRCVLPAVLVAGLALAGPAAAVDVADLADRLQDDPVLVDERSNVTPDEDALAAALEDLPVPTYVLVLPQADVEAEPDGIDGVLLRVVEALEDPRSVLVVVTDAGEVQAGEGGASGVEASALLDGIVQQRADQSFDGGTLTAALEEFAAAVERDGQEGAERGIERPGREGVGVAGLIGVALLAGGLLFARSQRAARRAGLPAAPADRSGE